MIAFQKNERVIKMIKNWAYIYKNQLQQENPPMHDQPAFRKALYFSDIYSTVLPSEYNIKIKTYAPIYKAANCKAKILHGRSRDLKKAINKINSHNGVEIYNFGPTPFQNLNHKIRMILNQ